MARRKTHRAAPACDTCGRPILWAITEFGNSQPLDPKPNPDGSVLAYKTEHLTWRARSTASVNEDSPRHPLERIYMPHFATCPGPKQEPIPANVTPIRKRAR